MQRLPVRFISQFLFFQADNKDPAERKEIVRSHLSGVEQLTQNLNATHIFNMDETPVYIDMVSNCTLDFKGNKNVDGVTTGHEKCRFTVALTISAAGNFLKTYVIFKGLKNVPKCNVPPSMVINVSKGGSMKEELMLDYCRRVLRARGSFLCTEESMLMLDTHASHTNDSVKKELHSLNIKHKYIPPKTTSYLQPLDVSVNSPFKSVMRNEWNKWYEEGPKEFTPKGYRKRPSYDCLLVMVSNAVNSIKPEVIIRSFEACGVAPMGQKVPIEHLNGRLKGVLGYKEGIEELQSDSESSGEDDNEELDIFQDGN